LKVIIYASGDKCDYSHRVPRNVATALPTSMEKEQLLEHLVNIPTVYCPDPEESSQHLNTLFKVYIILYYIILYIVYTFYKSALKISILLLLFRSPF